MNILSLNGINLNMFGKRDPAQYGTVTLAEIDANLKNLGKELGANVDCFQTNFEGARVERIHQAFHDKVDAVLINAQRGSGKRASLYTDYTFGVWDDEGNLVPFAKAYSGLTDAEIRQVDRFVRANTREKFGPVRSVTPELVFELAFEAIHFNRQFGRAFQFLEVLDFVAEDLCAEAQVEVFREGIALPATGFVDYFFAPNACGAVELQQQVAV